jgi:hypothetical protein
LPAGVVGDPQHEGVHGWLEFFCKTDGGFVDRLIAAAVGAWGVDDLGVVVKPASSCHHPCDAPPYCLPHDLLDEGGRSRLRNLTLGNCTIPPLHTYQALTKLVLQSLDTSTPVAAYERLFNDCTRLEVLHLKSCGCTEELDNLVVDAPGSAIRELLVEDCLFSEITLLALPLLARLACLGRTVMLENLDGQGREMREGDDLQGPIIACIYSGQGPRVYRRFTSNKLLDTNQP